MIETLADILGQEPQHEIAVLLKQGVFTPISTIGLRIDQVLQSVQFYSQARIGIQQIHFHFALSVKRNWQFNVQAELTGGLQQRFQTMIQERLRCTSGTAGPLRIGGHRPRCVDKEVQPWLSHCWMRNCGAS